NGLYSALAAGAGAFPRHESPMEAVRKAAPGTGVLLLADAYPDSCTTVDAALFSEAAKKRLRVYVEFPSWLPSLEVGRPRHATLERAVVMFSAFAPGLDRLRILAIHNCHFVPVNVAKADLVIARVAGFDKAVYGLPAEGVFPILFDHPDGSVLVATTQLSRFLESRDGPADAWPPIWNRIFQWVGGEAAAPKFHR